MWRGKRVNCHGTSSFLSHSGKECKCGGEKEWRRGENEKSEKDDSPASAGRKRPGA
jgi:hypothetical protein